MIFGLQSSKSLLEYIRQLVDIMSKYGSIVEGADNIHDMTAGSIMVYLLSINPTEYSVVGNLNISDEELNMLNFI
jgi:hypothetical protein